MLAGSSSAGATMSASPASIALRGMPSNLAEAGSCTKRHAGLLLDGPQPQRAVGAHAGEDHADAALLLVLRQGAEEEIDRQAQPRGAVAASRCSTPCRMDMSLFGGIT